MQGQILTYNTEAQTGIISAEDGKRYNFIGLEVRNAEAGIKQGTKVDFMLDDDGIPLEIYLLGTQSHSAPSQNSQPAHENNSTMVHSYAEQEITFQGLFSFKGCYTRRQYWSILIGVFFFEMILGSVLNGIFHEDSREDILGIGSAINSMKVTAIMFIISLPILWIMIATSVKRFHDINKSGAWVFFNLIPFIGNFVVFIMNGFFGSIRQGNLYSLPLSSENIHTNSASPAVEKISKPKLPAIILAPWFATVMFAPLGFIAALPLYDRHSDDQGLYLMFEAIFVVIFYIFAYKKGVPLSYEESKNFYVKENGVERAVGLLKLDQKSSWLLLTPTFVVLMQAIYSVFHNIQLVFMLSLAILVLVFYVKKSGISILAIGNEDNGHTKFTHFKPFVAAVLLIPFIMAVIFSQLPDDILHVFRPYMSKLTSSLILSLVSFALLYGLLKSTRLSTISDLKPLWPQIILFVNQNKKKTVIIAATVIVISSYFLLHLEHYPRSELSYNGTPGEYFGYGGELIINGCIDQEISEVANQKEFEKYADENGIFHLVIEDGHIVSGIELLDSNCELTVYKNGKPIEKKVLDYDGNMREIITWDEFGEAEIRTAEDGFKQAKPYDQQASRTGGVEAVEYDSLILK